MEPGSTSTPRSSAPGRATHSSYGCQRSEGPLQRLFPSDTVDWFPHPSPDGKHATYISFPTGTLGHPADLDVEVRLVRTDDWSDVQTRFPLFGGQGTINVNSWSPDSRRFAFAAYPIEQP